MKNYEYVSIKVQGFYEQGFVVHRDVINEYAARGFSYVGYIPTKMYNGAIREIDLIFEKDVEVK